MWGIGTVAVIVFCIGVIVQTSAFHPSSIFGGELVVTILVVCLSDEIFTGRFVTGLGVGSLSMAVPLYKYVLTILISTSTSLMGIRNSAELAPPEVRGSLVALQQLAITFGIMISFWIDYGTNYIGGTGGTQSEAAWRVPLALQLVPAIILGIGILFMPFSPRCVEL